jgi:hypothetical protein
MHPFISGRPARAIALEELIRRAQAIDGLWVAAGDEIAGRGAGLGLPGWLRATAVLGGGARSSSADASAEVRTPWR